VEVGTHDTVLLFVNVVLQ